MLIELPPPDISSFREGNTGIPFVFSFDSGRPGARVLINALTHGNEYSGAHVLCRLLRAGVRPARGRLTLSFANHEAFARFDPAAPFASRCVEQDFNRLWAPQVLDGREDSWELRRARELRPVVEQADFLLDLHSMHQGDTALLLAGVRAKSLALATAMGYPAHVVVDEGHRAGRRMRDYGAFDDPASPAVALLVESGQHWAAATLETALATTGRFLAQTGVTHPAELAALLPAGSDGLQRVIRVEQAVTAATDRFRFAADYRGLEVISARGELIAQDGEQEVVAPFADCVLVMPALAGTVRPGQTAVRLGRYLPQQPVFFKS